MTDHLNQRRRGRVLPDAGFYPETWAGPTELDPCLAHAVSGPASTSS